MQSDVRKTFYFQTDANPLGGFIEKPFEKNIPSHASSSLPNVGGYVHSEDEELNFEGIVSVRRAYTHVSGREVQRNGPWSIMATSVVEGLNILEVVTAERVVAQLCATFYSDGRLHEYVCTGSCIQDLRIGGSIAPLVPNRRLLNIAESAEAGITWPVFQETGRAQAGKLVESAGLTGGDADRWIAERFGWMNSKEPREDGLVLCSLVDSVERAIPARSFGHCIIIPDFGRIFIQELLVTKSSVQLSAPSWAATL
jgi:hypothetical protein